jgi:hypothetical protein
MGTFLTSFDIAKFFILTGLSIRGIFGRQPSSDPRAYYGQVQLFPQT